MEEKIRWTAGRLKLNPSRVDGGHELSAIRQATVELSCLEAGARCLIDNVGYDGVETVLEDRIVAPSLYSLAGKKDIHAVLPSRREIEIVNLLICPWTSIVPRDDLIGLCWSPTIHNNPRKHEFFRDGIQLRVS